jgi:hypothetical protein
MNEIIRARVTKNLCPICAEQINKEIVITSRYGETDLIVCKTHIKYGGKDAEKNNIK